MEGEEGKETQERSVMDHRVRQGRGEGSAPKP